MKSNPRGATTGRMAAGVASLGLVLLALGVALLLTYLTTTAQLQTLNKYGFEQSSALGPVGAVALELYLAANLQELAHPREPGGQPVPFHVIPGDTAQSVALNLVASGILGNADVFTAYLRFYGLDTHLEAGEYRVSSGMTIPQLAAALTNPASPDIMIRIPEGWRREQIAAWIDSQANLPFSGQDFLSSTDSASFITDTTAIKSEIPDGVTLEGWLFPDTYQVARDARAIDLVQKALSNLDTKIDANMRARMRSENRPLYQVLTLASIVEREAAVSNERPIIASVYLNRLAIDMKLEADPTVQYSMGYQEQTGDWWNLNLTVDDYQNVNSPYNTYLNAGLPPGPISNPSLSSIAAVVYPAQTKYLFFRAKCDGSGEHYFTETYDEHLSYACP